MEVVCNLNVVFDWKKEPGKTKQTQMFQFVFNYHVILFPAVYNLQKFIICLLIVYSVFCFCFTINFFMYKERISWIPKSEVGQPRDWLFDLFSTAVSVGHCWEELTLIAPHRTQLPLAFAFSFHCWGFAVDMENESIPTTHQGGWRYGQQLESD